MELREAIIHALNGDAILFLGSGFSVGAIKENLSKFITAGPLAHKLLTISGFDDKDLFDDLGQASQIYLQMHTESELVDYLRDEFIAVNTTAAQQVIAALPWQRVYTTNYDNVFELAALQKGKTVHSAVLSERPNDYRNKSKLCIHLNGDIQKLTCEKLFSEFKLLNVSYLTEEFSKSEWLTLFRSDLATAKAVFFVGYSMQYDLDLRRIIYNTPDLKDKTFFILWERESKGNQLLVSEFGTPFPINVEGFADAINETSKSYIATTKLPASYLCFKQPVVSKTPPTILDSDEFDFLVKGVYNTEKLYYSHISKDIHYSIHRSKIENVMTQINNGESKILIHSDLGNGKSVFIETLAALLSRESYAVYTFYRYRASIDREIESICQSHEKVVIIFEDYLSKLDYLKTLKIHRTDQILIVTERTASNEIGYDDLYRLFGDFRCIDINCLDDTEIKDFTDLLNLYGFWAELSSYKIDRKDDFIKRVCKGQIRNVIVKLLNSSNIISKFSDLVNSVKTQKGYYEAILFILIAQVSKLDVDIEDLAEGLDINRLNNPNFRRDRFVREFVEFDGVTIKMKSAIVAEVLLKKIFDSSIIVDVLLGIYRRLNEHNHDPKNKKILRKLTQFTNVQHMLNKDDASYKYNLLSYYEGLKCLSFCAENPNFWLQYAIVKLSEYDYMQAKVYFDTAYSFARKTGFDTYQIDNHYARFILENEMQNGNQNTCMDAFSHAHAILMDTKHKTDVRYYPYRVARNYYPFYEHFFAGMTKTEQQTFLSSCHDMLKRLEWYVSTSIIAEYRPDVKRAKEDLLKLLAEQNAL